MSYTFGDLISAVTDSFPIHFVLVSIHSFAFARFGDNKRFNSAAWIESHGKYSESEFDAKRNSCMYNMFQNISEFITYCNVQYSLCWNNRLSQYWLSHITFYWLLFTNSNYITLLFYSSYTAGMLKYTRRTDCTSDVFNLCLYTHFTWGRKMNWVVLISFVKSLVIYSKTVVASVKCIFINDERSTLFSCSCAWLFSSTIITNVK